MSNNKILLLQHLVELNQGKKKQTVLIDDLVVQFNLSRDEVIEVIVNWLMTPKVESA